MSEPHYFHDLCCKASRSLPMGCDGCSCAMYKRASRAERERDAYREIAIEYFDSQGPYPENHADVDVVCDVEALCDEILRKPRTTGDQT